MIIFLYEYLNQIEQLKSSQFNATDCQILSNLSFTLLRKSIFPKTKDLVVKVCIRVADLLIGRGNDMNFSKKQAKDILIEVLKLNPDIRTQIKVYSMLSVLSHIMKESKAALKYNQMSIKLGESLGDAYLLSRAYNDACTLNVFYGGNVEASDFYAKKSEQLAYRTYEQDILYHYLYNSAFSSIGANNPEKAARQLIKAKELYDNFDLEMGSQDIVLWVVWKKFLSICMLGLNESNQAEKDIKEAITISKKYGLGHQEDSLNKLYKNFDYNLILKQMINK